MILRYQGIPPFQYLCEQRRSFYTNQARTAPLVQDGVFKALFHDTKNPSKLIHFLQAINPKREIDKVEFQDSYFPAYSRGEKDIYVDIVCKAWEKRNPIPDIYVVEMQQVEKEGFFKRWDFYASRCYTNELLKAKTYDQLLKVHVIALMMHPSQYPNDTYELTGNTTGEKIPESRSITLLSLDECNPTLSENPSELEKWSHLIKFSGTSKLNINALTTDAIFSQAIMDLEHLQKNPHKIPGARKRISKGTPWHLLQKEIKDTVLKRET